MTTIWRVVGGDRDERDLGELAVEIAQGQRTSTLRGPGAVHEGCGESPMNVDLIEESTGELIWYGSLDEFLAANELAGDLDAEDRIHLRQNLVAGEDYLFGGGAAPLLVLREACEEGGYGTDCATATGMYDAW